MPTDIMHKIGCVVLVGFFYIQFAGCSSIAKITTEAPATETPDKSEVRQRLAVHIEDDPNAKLCDKIIHSLEAWDIEAFTPYFDTADFAERIIAYRPLSEETVSSLRRYHDQYENFTRFLNPEGAQFLCLGTRTFLDNPHMVIRVWTPGRYDYVFLHLKDAEQYVIIDYFVVSSGLYHSEKQAYYFDSDIDSTMISKWLLMSHRNEFQQIIDEYKSLTEEVRMSPYAFSHYINAVFTLERTESPLYAQAVEYIDEVFGNRIYSVAYWKMIDARRRGDFKTHEYYRNMLVDLLDDYEFLR